MNKTQSGAEWAVSIVAGTGEPGYSGDGSLALEARLNNPFDLAFAPDSSLVFSDTFNHCIRRLMRRAALFRRFAAPARRDFLATVALLCVRN